MAFGIPALVKIIARKKKKSVVVLVVAPTRELAIQTHDTLNALGEPFGITSVAVFGGVSKDTQVKDLARSSARIVVGTPGRILDLVNDGACNLKQCVFFFLVIHLAHHHSVSYLVLDEADRMLDKGFENDIRTIISHTKQGAKRQTMMCPSFSLLRTSPLNPPSQRHMA